MDPAAGTIPRGGFDVRKGNDLCGRVFDGYMRFCTPMKAQDVEMQLEVSDGRSVREFRFSDVEGAALTSVHCVFQSQGIAWRWLASNLMGRWAI